ncbi:hypothetical protein LAA48_004328 [Salmonella enterica subsp. enterica serovar Indiana]|uniref:Uncharacterized protein n=3 Tax=root TaxID=1 RepID=A0A7G3T3H1_9CAUD|nr:hypothetical protein [Salmonella enterica]YP_010582244.1 hypothetical protein PF620_gp11 [Salmonella phage TS6]YP_010582340.1 hypothetical protein PF621_gp42 [Salmonella phage vB_SenTO17]ECI4718665.1 hypothetical protein [Salmonella enterica subsp. enterica]EIC4202414.1 hypothetical protein [Salmonella enterica subsp. enterica serovar Indiana]AZF89054.1 hypothetical protein AP6_011 [Salmonella phage TS6]QJQ80425.1 hypothetical protein vBSenTO17_42 [Salmonella phage vB_SenTO17]HAD1965511.1
MKYELYSAIDTRDNKPMYWLLAGVYPERKLALFTPKTMAADVKRKTAAAPDSIIWESTKAWYAHAALEGAKLIYSWEFRQ